MKVIRKSFEILNKIKSVIRIILVRLKYSNIEIGFNSYIGKNCRIHCDNDGKIILKEVYLSDGVVLQARRSGQITIEKCYLGYNSVVVAIENISIGRDVEIAEMTVIRDQDHRFDFSDTPISKQGFYHNPISIGDNTWIGAKASILKGTTIGHNCLVGAHSLTREVSFPDGSLVVGTPARIVTKKSNKGSVV